MVKVRFKKKVNVLRVVGKLFGTLLGMWVGGVLVSNLGSTMMCTHSALYGGLSLIGWTVTSSAIAGGATLNATGVCLRGTHGLVDGTTYYNIITGTSATSTGILTVIGLIGIASIVMEFVQFKL